MGGEWIDLEDRLPPESSNKEQREFLASDGECIIVGTSDGVGVRDDEGTEFPATHWQPLPDLPPKRRDETESPARP